MATGVMTAPEGRIIHKTYSVLSGAAIPQRVHVTQYDESLPVIACTLYKDGQLYTIPDGASVRLRMNKNGLPVYHEAIGIDDARHVVYLEITAQMTVLYGEFAMVIEVETSDGKTAGTSYLRLIVRQNPVQNPDLDNIPDYTANSNKLTAEGVKKLQDESSTQQKAIEDKAKKTLESIPADYSALSGKVDENANGISELKEDLVNKSEGQIRGLLVKDSYVEKDGTIAEYTGWSRTNYIDVSQYSLLSLYIEKIIRFGVWLKEDKTTVVFPIETTTVGNITLFVPLDAKYLIISEITEYMDKLKIYGKRRKSDNLVFNGKRININYIANGYIEHGNLQSAGRWAATDYIEIPKDLYIESDGTEEDNAYNAFYDENKVYISSFNTKGKYLKVPDNAKYMRLSTLNSNEQRVYTRHPLLLKVGSFNVGIWTDGKSSNARVDPANVKAEGIKLRRFLGNTNFDFLLCEEATHEFDKDYKIDAYEYCFENNLPFYWKTKSSTEGSPQVRQFLLTGKYELINVTYHDYECESTRGYVTFECNISGRNITFIVCHLSLESSSDGIRQQEMEELANILKKCEYGVLCGDFNAFSIDEFTTHFSEFNLSNHGYYGDFNTWPVTGWESWNHCLDNIITTKSIKITNVLMGEIAMSDHKPLIAEIEIL